MLLSRWPAIGRQDLVGVFAELGRRVDDDSTSAIARLVANDDLGTMTRYVMGLQEIDQTQVELVGGKGAHLGELSRLAL